MTALDTFTAAYVECALWSTNADHLDPEGTGSAGSLEDHVGAEDITSEALASIVADCAAFQAHEANDLDSAHITPTQAGHDFWLTRNHHGTGFWDRGLGARGDRLTAAADAYGESYLYVGDDGKVYVS
jgi:hypothetical protein